MALDPSNYGARIEIRSLIDRYALAMDDGNVDEVLGLYAPDGEFERIQATVRGQDELRATYTRILGRYHPTRHSPAVHVIKSLEESMATGTQTGTAELVETGVGLKAAYRFEDVYTKTPAGWRFQRRSLRYMWVIESPELTEIFASNDRIRWPNQPPQAGHYE